MTTTTNNKDQIYLASFNSWMVTVVHFCSLGLKIKLTYNLDVEKKKHIFPIYKWPHNQVAMLQGEDL